MADVTQRAHWRVPLSPQERAAQLAKEERELQCAERLAYFRALGGCVLSLVLGLALVGWALHTTNQRWAGAAFWGGLLVGYGGITVTLARLYRNGEDAGWW